MKTKHKSWFVYIVECMDGSFYTGVTNDIDKRMKAHSENRGSKYVMSRGFGRLLRTKKCTSKSDAHKTEYYIKTLPKYKKLNWFD